MQPSRKDHCQVTMSKAESLKDHEWTVAEIYPSQTTIVRVYGTSSDIEEAKVRGHGVSIFLEDHDRYYLRENSVWLVMAKVN